MIKVGDKLPEATFGVVTPSGPATKTTSEVFSGRKVALFAVPGAFTPTCHNNHLPGFLANADKFKEKGVDAIACLAVNDVFVMDAWAKATGAGETIEFLADGSALFSKATGLELDITERGMGIRSQRYAMLVDDGVVTILNIGDEPGKTDITGAEALLAAM
ncbi:peroxiredoxin [Microbaculum marinisediminis]|uniref:Glutathione-dependent peroxiredoxin n=1 Tax=Microbaculum marinisediminis TaxID=2931392 RepID=A0AAW5QRR5_9HYPH|nr:peroxiredoxin [Microbaculum sp. A6E488]MCT8970338.1 peroxiredoxin [Microbaculum sp. A6E488]